MLEKKFQILFGKWAKSNFKESAAFELKSCRGNSLPFSCVQDHQKLGLENAKNNKIFMKLIDAGYQQPFDCFMLYKTLAFIVVKFPSFFCLIGIDDWTNEEKRSDRKSLTSERAKEIASMVVDK